MLAIFTDDYAILAERLDFPNSIRLTNILKFLISSDQAKIINILPGSPEEVAPKLAMDVQTVKNHFKELYKKGVIFPRGESETYRFSRDIIQFHDATLATVDVDPVRDREFAGLWHDFCINESYPYKAKKAEQADRPFARVVPAYNAIKDLDGVQPWENFRELLMAQDLIAVVPCACRLRTTAVEEPCKYTHETEQSHCFQLGKGAKYAISRGSGKQLSLEEALDLADKAEADGLVHIWSFDRRMHITTCCSCCSDCCEIFVSSSQNAVDIGKFYAKSRYAAFVNQEECNGCKSCYKQCQFNAIKIESYGQKNKASVEVDKCFGCGVCTLKCKTGAMKLRAIHPPEYVPES